MVFVAMPKPGSAETASELADKMSVLVAYEDTPAHDRARQYCERLLNRFWGDLDFDFSWWSFDFLRDAVRAKAAAAAAAKAQLIIFSVRTSTGLPLAVRNWSETWLGLRKIRGGALAVLFEAADPKKPAPTITYLRQLAEQACLDFLQEGATESATVPGEAERPGAKRKGRVTTALKQILDPHSRPAHWGINE